ncbi:MAG: CoA synthetase [Rhodobacteraceae bacterium]|nr:CoA synthetase [Paracoccaceae bacterium]MBR26671.1 CoA synthetase [Paracoccaceae bacterium]|tara:strand:- start:144 stop:899 length:756 start_codon:yes stop_codon:yes gene_type:complete
MSAGETDVRPEEIQAAAIAGLLEGARHVAVGMVSPIPGTGALLANERSGGGTRVSILGSKKTTFWTNGGSELFDLAGRGRLDAFFLSGGQIDGGANVNLVGVGDYPEAKVRWSGSFGSAYLYFVVPRVILFRWEHTRRTLVEKVDFVSAPGTSEPGVHRPGGPIALITNLCLFDFQREAGRFRLKSLHPGVTLEEVRDNTGFDFDLPEHLAETPTPDADTLSLIRGPVARRIADVYPVFARQVFGTEPAAA